MLAYKNGPVLVKAPDGAGTPALHLPGRVGPILESWELLSTYFLFVRSSLYGRELSYYYNYD